jgi:4-hydroxybenzoate polyprenyltransferase
MSNATTLVSDNPSWKTTIGHYLSLIRFSHTIFALPFALLATAWAYVVPLPVAASGDQNQFLPLRWQPLVGIVLCMVTARSFAMAMNRLLDQRWDAENPRTASRHLPAKILSRGQVAGFSLLCAIGFMASCGLFWPNKLPLLLSLPVLLFLAGYSLGKRFTRLVHFWLGIALMLAPVCAWIALRGEAVMAHPSDLAPVLMLGTVVFLWVSGFDIIYACQDHEYDKGAGLFSIPAKLGIRNALRVAASCHALMWMVAFSMSLLLPDLSLGWLYVVMLFVVGCLLVYEHSVVSENSLARIQLAFFQLNSVISVLFLVVGTIDAYWR